MAQPAFGWAVQLYHGAMNGETSGIGNRFDDVSGGAVAIGGRGPAGPAANRGNRVENNRVHHVARDYHGSPAILLTGTQDTTVAHNQVNDVGTAASWSTAATAPAASRCSTTWCSGR